MKIFYKKDFQRVLEKKIELEKEFEKYKEDTSNSIRALEDRNFKLLQEKSKLKDTNEKQECILNEQVNTLKLELSLTKEKLKKANTSKGGYVKEINKLKREKEELITQISDLKAQNHDLNDKISDLQSDRYLIKKIPAGRTKNTVKTQIAAPMKPAVRKFMQENFD